MWIEAYPWTTTLGQNILSLSNLPAKRDKSIWSGTEGTTENESLTAILFAALGMQHLQRTEREMEGK